MKAFYSRLVPFGLMRQAEDSVGFDAYPVNVPEEAIETCEYLRSIQKTMSDLADISPAPEESAQEEADQLVSLIGGL